MKSKEKKSPKKVEQAMVMDQDLKAKAGVLFQVLLAVRETNPEATSELLWQNAKQRWTSDDLQAAFDEFKKSGSPDRFASLFRPLPRAGKDGFFTYEGRRYTSEARLAKLLGMHPATMRQRISQIRRMRGRNCINRELQFFCIEDAQLVFKDFLEVNSQRSDKDGVIKIGGHLWGTETHCALLAGLHGKTTKRFLIGVSQIKGRDFKGHLKTFYRVSEVQKNASPLAGRKVRANGEGTAKYQGEVWCTLTTLLRKFAFRILKGTLMKALSQVRVLDGRSSSGQAVKLYSLADVRRVCARELKVSRVRVGDEGFVKIKGCVWGTTAGCALKEGLEFGTVASRLDGLTTLQGIDRAGHERTLYRLLDVHARCADLAAALPRASVKGFFTYQREVWGHQSALCLPLGVKKVLWKARVGRVRSMAGKDYQGHRTTFYAVSDFEIAFMDLLIKKGLRQGVGEEVLKKHSSILAKVFYRLNDEKQEVTADQLWQLLRTRWSEEMLEEALKAYRAKRDLSAFLKLLG